MIKEIILEFKVRRLLNKMDKLYVSEKALAFYRECVNGNLYEDKKVLIKKLKRNYVLGKKINEYTVRYGNLIIYHTNNRITSIYNSRRKLTDNNIDYCLKEKLDYILNL